MDIKVRHIGKRFRQRRVLEDISAIDEFRRLPWTSGYLQGIVDAPFLNITPGTRLGVVHDVRFAEFTDALGPLEEALLQILKEQQQAEEEKTSRQTLRSIQKALREALLTLPEEEYDWFDIGGRSGKDYHSRGSRGTAMAESEVPYEVGGDAASADVSSIAARNPMVRKRMVVPFIRCRGGPFRPRRYP